MAYGPIQKVSMMFSDQRHNPQPHATFANFWYVISVIRHGDHVVRSGLISEETKLTFRSRSARIIWLVQMSSEMWDFASPFNTAGRVDRESACKIYFDKFVEFVRRLFDKWKKLQVR